MATKQIILGLPENPYQVLDVPYEADTAQINAGMRGLFRRDPRNAARRGNKAQKALHNPEERVRVDAFCHPVEMVAEGLGDLTAKLGEADLACTLLADLSLLSDLHFPENLLLAEPPRLHLGELVYRDAYAIE